MSYEEKISQLEQFTSMLDTCSCPEEFVICLTLNAMGKWGTRRFFDECLFPFLFEGGTCRGKELRLRIALKSKLPLLQTTYGLLPE